MIALSFSGTVKPQSTPVHIDICRGILVINNVTTHMHTHALSDTITHSAKPSCVAQRVWSVSAGRAGRRRWRRLPDVRREQYWISLPSLTDYHGDVF